jgi:chromosome segregation ATPase
VLSSKGDSKHETRFAARIDVLTERVDTLAATVATTASAMAKKDGEIAALRRDLEARDQALQALAAQVRSAANAPAAGGAAIDANELRSLRNAVASLMKDRSEAGVAGGVELATTVRQLKERVDQLAAAAKSDRHSDELRVMLTSLRSQVEAIGDLRSSAIEQQLGARLAGTDEALGELRARIDALASSVESATSSLAEKENELVALHRDITESSERVETVVQDIREALSTLPEPGSAAVDEVAARVERLEQLVRDVAGARARGVEELSRRLDILEPRVTTVATEIAHAKTLWPVALRSLEARLEDAVHHHRAGSPGTEGASDAAPDDDLLAGLRTSLEAMESVAAEMARASDVLVPPEAEAEPDSEPVAETPVEIHGPVAAGGAIVPLRTGEP